MGMNHSMANRKNECRVAEYNNQWSSEKNYQARIDFLMSGSQEQAGANLAGEDRVSGDSG